MNIFQATSGYRTPAKSMTVQALEQRLKAAQEARQQSSVLDQTVADPMQGFAYLMNNLAGQANEYRAESADIQARDQLAKIKAGIDWSKGPSSEQYAEYSRLDPEGADKVMQDWVNYRQDMEKQARQNEFTTSERLSTQGFQTTQQDDQQAAAIELAQKNQAMDVEETKRQEQQKLDAIGLETEKRKAEWLKLHPGDDMTSDEAQAYILRDAAPATGGWGGPAGDKAVIDWNSQVSGYDSALNNFDRALTLADQIPDEMFNDSTLMVAKMASGIGGTGGLEYALGKLKEMGWTNVTPQQVNALLEYDRIVGLNAMTTMSQTLKGQSTDREMMAFLQRLNAGGMTREERKRMLNNLKGAVVKDRNFIAQKLTERGYQTDPYASAAPAVSTTTTPAPAANADLDTMTPEQLAEERRRLEASP